MTAAAKEARLRVTEIFLSLQGEAATVGFPTVFVRLTGCPLRCRYCVVIDGICSASQPAIASSSRRMAWQVCTVSVSPHNCAAAIRMRYDAISMCSKA